MSNMHKDWDDLRYFLAVARAGTLSGAARTLDVNHSTIFRRIAAFEEHLGVRLFERLPNGYVLTPAGGQMQKVALRIEDEIASLDRRLAGQDNRLTGTVRITTIDMLAIGVLPRHLAVFRAAYPDIEIDLTISNSLLSLTRREADVALRVSRDPPETLVGRRVSRLVFAVYGSPDYCARRAESELGRHDWIGFDSEHAALERRFAEFLPAVRPVLKVNSVAVAIAAARAGIGLAVLPCGLADMEHDLHKVAPLPDEFTLDLWLLTHEDLRTTARIRAVLDFVADRFSAEADLFGGMRPEAWRDRRPRRESLPAAV
ncbi:MAG: putative HTH-type transcriptional regulator [Rhizobiaceae bacterium]|jgi:DNA-binding transcriptional LysR family regulator|nr:putative HTH-type transcriptional regulator [Rhizobiaceae bacterium]